MSARFAAAQRRYDNELPEPDAPEPTDAQHCVCGEYPWFDVDRNGQRIRCACGCGEVGAWRRDRGDAVDAWNGRVAEAKIEVSL